MKSVLVALLAVLALGAVAASGASAHEFFIEGKSMKELGLKEEAFTSKTSVITLSGASGNLEFSCSKGNGKGMLGQGGTGLAMLELSGCTGEKPTGCQVVEPIVLKNLNADLVEVGGVLSDEFALPEPYYLHFIECDQITEFEIEGQFTGKIKSEVEKEQQEVVFNTGSGSKFMLGGKPARLLFTETFQLSGANSGKKWSARK